MSSTILQVLLEVSGLAPADTVTISHGLRRGTLALAPNKILPDRGTPIAVQSFDDTEITFVNNGSIDEDANFLVQYDHSIQQAAASPPVDLVWLGMSAGTSGAPSDAPYLTQGAVAGLTDERNIEAVTATLAFIAAGDAVVPLAAQRFSAGATADIFQTRDENGDAILHFLASGDLQWANGGGLDRTISTANATAGNIPDAIIIRGGNGFTDPAAPTSANDISIITGNGGNGGATPPTGGGNFNVYTGHGFGDASEGGNINFYPDTTSTTPGSVNIATPLGENPITIGNINALIGLYGGTPVPQASPIGSPAGGAVIDAECRAAVDEIIVAIAGIGVTQ